MLNVHFSSEIESRRRFKSCTSLGQSRFVCNPFSQFAYICAYRERWRKRETVAIHVNIYLLFVPYSLAGVACAATKLIFSSALGNVCLCIYSRRFDKLHTLCYFVQLWMGLGSLATHIGIFAYFIFSLLLKKQFLLISINKRWKLIHWFCGVYFAKMRAIGRASYQSLEIQRAQLLYFQIIVFFHLKYFICLNRFWMARFFPLFASSWRQSDWRFSFICENILSGKFWTTPTNFSNFFFKLNLNARFFCIEQIDRSNFIGEFSFLRYFWSDKLFRARTKNILPDDNIMDSCKFLFVFDKWTRSCTKENSQWDDSIRSFSTGRRNDWSWKSEKLIEKKRWQGWWWMLCDSHSLSQ